MTLVVRFPYCLLSADPCICLKTLLDREQLLSSLSSGVEAVLQCDRGGRNWSRQDIEGVPSSRCTSEIGGLRLGRSCTFSGCLALARRVILRMLPTIPRSLAALSISAFRLSPACIDSRHRVMTVLFWAYGRAGHRSRYQGRKGRWMACVRAKPA